MREWRVFQGLPKEIYAPESTFLGVSQGFFLLTVCVFLCILQGVLFGI